MGTTNIETARCYATVFRGEPWNEAFRDNQDNFIAASPELNTSWWKLGLERAYPLRETADYITQETNRPQAVSIIENNDIGKPNRVTAFGWGYGFNNKQEFVESKWASNTEAQRTILQALTKISDENLWYLSEVGVIGEFRGQGLATNIVNELLEKAPRGSTVLMRTTATSPMTKIAEKKDMQPIIGPAETLAGIIGQLPLDPINPNRVVYMLAVYQ